MKLPKRAQKWYIQRYLPIKTDRIKILEREGEVIYLPFVRETINWFEKEEITSMLNRIIVTREAQNIITAKELRPYLDDSLRIDGELIPLFLINQILERCRREKRISKKEMRLVLTDSKDKRTEAVIYAVKDGLNYLTVLTERAEYFENIAMELYEDTGLLMEIKESPLEEMIEGDIVIDFEKEERRNYRYYPKGAYILDFSGNREKSRNFAAKRKDILLANRVEVTAKGEEIENSLLQAIICGQTTWMGKNEIEYYMEEAKEFEIQLKALKMSLYS